MSERASSNTAWSVMVLRAAHLLLDDPPAILDDSVALRLLGEHGAAGIRAATDRLRTPGARSLRAHMLVRSRYAEDQLAVACARGVRQFIVLGAGYDTFAYRQPEWAHSLTIYEVDHPSSQRAKQQALADSGIVVPANVVYAAIDFEHETLAAGLARSGFDATQPAFLSCLGVLMYLTREAVDAIFAFVRALPASSELVATFKAAVEGQDVGAGPVAQAAAAAGEPWLTQFDPWELEAELVAQGFADVTMVTGAELEVRYAKRRRDGVQPARSMMILDLQT